MMEQATKKAVRLEDKIGEVERELAEAKRVLAAAEAKIADELREAKEKEKEASKAEDVAARVHEAARKEATSRLGLTPAAAKRAVVAWAGLNPGEEEEGIVRGDSQTIEHAVAKLVSSIVERDATVVAVSKIHKQRSQERSRASTVRSVVEHKTSREEDAVRRCTYALRELTEKIQARDRNKAKEAAKAISKEDQARFVEARRRLAAAANVGGYGDDVKFEKLSPPFVWPPKDK